MGGSQLLFQRPQSAWLKLGISETEERLPKLVRRRREQPTIWPVKVERWPVVIAIPDHSAERFVPPVYLLIGLLFTGHLQAGRKQRTESIERTYQATIANYQVRIDL